MTRTQRLTILVVAGIGAASLLGAPGASGQTAASISLSDTLGRRFVENQGQWPDDVRFAAGSGDRHVWVGSRAVSFRLRDPETGRAVTVTLELDDPTLMPSPRGVDRLPGVHHYLRGSDPDGWATHVPAYRSVVLESPEDGIALRVTPRSGGAELALEVGRGTPRRDLALRVEGATAVVDEDGSPALRTPLGTLRACCHACGTQRAAACPACRGGLQWDSEARLRWSLPETSNAAGATLGVVWSTFLAGNSADSVIAVAFASDEGIVVGGETLSQDFPTTPGAFDPTHAPPHPTGLDADIFVARLEPDGSDLVYATFVGGSQNDFCSGIALVGADEPVVLGWVGSSDYPTTPDAFAPRATLPIDCVITRLTSDGSALVFSTFLGGESNDVARDLAIAPDGVVVVVGSTCSPDFPVTPGAYDTTLHEDLPPCFQDGFITKLAPDGSSLVFSSFLGAGGVDSVPAVAVRPGGDLALGGQAGAPDFPVTPGTFQDLLPGKSFVARMSADGSELQWSTFFAGTASNDVTDVAVDAMGTVTVAGKVSTGPSTWFPTTQGAFDTTYSAPSDAFLSRISARGTELISSTFLGGVGDEWGLGVVLDPGGVATVLGHTRSRNFPVTPGAHDTSHNGDWDFFVGRLGPERNRLFYSTFVGGPKRERSNPPGLAVGPDGEVVFVGDTLSGGYPTTSGSFDTTPDVGLNGVVTKLTMLPKGVQGLGNSTPGCTGGLTIGVTAMPRKGTRDFGLWSSGARPFEQGGWLGVSLAPLQTPLLVTGVELWLDPATLRLQPVSSDALGFCEVPQPIKNDVTLVGHQTWVQFFWPDSCATSGWAASRALEITIQL